MNILKKYNAKIVMLIKSTLYHCIHNTISHTELNVHTSRNASGNDACFGMCLVEKWEWAAKGFLIISALCGVLLKKILE